MKKLMIAAAAAAMIGGVQAIPATGEQAYTMSLTVKTTVAAQGKIADAIAKCDTEAAAYRKQASKKIAGLIWGCFCDTLNNPSFGEYSGFVFWNVSDKFQYNDLQTTAFDWTSGWDWTTQIDRINNDGKKSEGIWHLTLASLDSEGSSVTEYNLTGAGFGTAAGYITVTDDETERSFIYVPTMSGYFVGTRSYTFSKCTTGHCGEVDVTVSGVAAWPLCACGEAPEKTVAYGSWNIKFNNSVATKFAKTGDITKSYSFPKYVTEFGENYQEAE